MIVVDTMIDEVGLLRCRHSMWLKFGHMHTMRRPSVVHQRLTCHVDPLLLPFCARCQHMLCGLVHHHYLFFFLSFLLNAEHHHHHHHHHHFPKSSSPMIIFFYLIFLMINHMNLGSRFLTHSTSSITPQ